MTTRLMLNIRDPKLVQGSLHSILISRSIVGIQRATSTDPDPYTRENEFLGATHHHNMRLCEESEYSGHTRSAGMCYEILIINIRH